MASTERFRLACLVVPASTALLAGMAWRVGWIGPAVVGPVLFALVIPVVACVALLVASLPVLAFGLLVALVLRAARWVRRQAKAPLASERAGWVP